MSRRFPVHLNRFRMADRGVALLAFMLTATASHAARPMNTDDARTVDPKACQVESWVRKNADSTEFWVMPACNPTGNLELSAGGSHTRGESEGSHNSVMLQAKTVFKPLETNGWGWGLAAGTVRHGQPFSGHDWYAYVPVSRSLFDDRSVLHLNLGWLREAQSQRNFMTWGIGSETQLSERVWLIGETFGQNEGRPLYQAGLRYWVVPNRVQVDATYGNRLGGGERWFSIGLRLLSPAFLP
ncbi:hypothetical protein [Ottowia thiooxydans]|uniref:Transporter n=1 Tax=Ottowia thiooxydans TaxID=219182 RepID=A0ABV2Q9P4_9BURK